MTPEPVLLAIDFTAETLRLLMVEPGGSPLGREQWPLPELADAKAWSWEVGGRIATFFARDDERRSAVGIAIAAPGAVDATTGTLLRSTGQGTWDGLAVADAVRRHIDAPVVAESRTVAALTGERWQAWTTRCTSRCAGSRLSRRSSEAASCGEPTARRARCPRCRS